MAHSEEKHSYYLRVNEPFKFAAQLEAAAGAAAQKGFDVRFDFGGPEEFPTHSFTAADIGPKKALIITDSIAYWTKASLTVTGKSEDENNRCAEETASLIAESIEMHRQ